MVLTEVERLLTLFLHCFVITHFYKQKNSASIHNYIYIHATPPSVICSISIIIKNYHNYHSCVVNCLALLIMTFFKPGMHNRRPHTPCFLKSLCSCVGMCVNVSVPEGINNQWHDMVWYRPCVLAWSNPFYSFIALDKLDGRGLNNAACCEDQAKMLKLMPH